MRFLMVFIMVFHAALASAGERQANPHQISALSKGETCLRCHVSPPDGLPTEPGRSLSVNRSDYRLDGVQMCMGCHEAGSAAHMVGKLSPVMIPENMPLSEQGSVTCLTCHYVHGSFESDRPWANVSFFDRLFVSEYMYKSYLLRQSNENGELCLLCHRADGYADEIH